MILRVDFDLKNLCESFFQLFIILEYMISRHEMFRLANYKQFAFVSFSVFL